ncbi:outer membrane beta-barrel protein [Gelidibacter salicanalis]|uniref:Porin n=1 Tax=Gelidibacter salicanalis TaxID=291193 RepID=A0A934NBF5_9FLAO|nr:outer membrane beta-barrel protein [Gelidibacter salicanalis]MBJ7879570.1 porin [Gelidibacter salicanalis]
MKSKFTFLLVFFSLLLCAQEQQEKKFTITGSVDVYFRTNLTGPNEAYKDEEGNSIFLNPGTSFANRSGFSLGMANAIFSYEGEKVGFVADLVFGPRGEDAVFLSTGSANIINQLYAYWNVTDRVRLTLGNFNTFLGYEVISPAGNFYYSTSYMFSNGPFSHTGLKADVELSDELSLLLAVMNSTDYTEINLDGSYTLGGQLGFKDQYLNFIYGNQTGNSEATFQVDYTGGTDVSNAFFLGINATYNTTDGSGFYGAALYPKYTISETFALGLRGEYFGLHSENFDDDTVFAATLSANYTIQELTIIPELRVDNWSEDAYVDTNFDPTKHLASFLIAAVYKF